MIDGCIYDVLVVAPYNARVAALQRRLSALGIERVGTVDRFQGQKANPSAEPPNRCGG